VSSIPPIINALPAGYLDLLGLKTMGRNPTSPGGSVSPVFDLQDWYAAGQAELVVSSVFVRAAGGSTMSDLGVPPDQTWLVDTMTLLVNPAAGVTTCRAQLTVQAQNAAGSFQIYASPIQSFGPGSQGFVELADRRLILRPGDLFGLQLVEYAGAGNVTAQVQARIARLSI